MIQDKCKAVKKGSITSYTVGTNASKGKNKNKK